MRSRSGFTLLEILVAIAMTSVIMLVAVQIFRQITQAQDHARPDRSRDQAALVFLDRIERELIGTTLRIKPDEIDRLSFPWLFVAEDRVFGSNDSDALRFVTQTPARAPGQRDGGLRVVHYALAEAPENGERLDLYRFEERLPPNMQKEIRVDDGSPVLEDVYAFRLRFAADAGWLDSWDSTAIALLDRLPDSVEVAIQLYEEDELGDWAPGPEQTRLIELPLSPFGPPELVAVEEGCSTGPTVDECLAGYSEALRRQSAALSAPPERAPGQQPILKFQGQLDGTEDQKDRKEDPLAYDGDFQAALEEANALRGGCWTPEGQPPAELIALHTAFELATGIAPDEACAR